jgi:hypothetical protein
MSDSDDNSRDLDPGTWDSLPADSESEAEFPEFQQLPEFTGKVVYLPQPDLPDDLVVEMVVRFPDGVTWEHSERVDFEQAKHLDVNAQAAAMIEEVSEAMKSRIGRTLD